MGIGPKEEELFSRLKELIVREFSVPEEKITLQATLRGTLEMHSLQLVQLAVLLEENFGAGEGGEIDFEAYVELRTLGDVVEFLSSALGARRSALGDRRSTT